MKLLKCKEHDEIFKIIEKAKHWIENWDTFLFIAEQTGISWQELLSQVEEIPFEDLRDNYGVGKTLMKKTITEIIEDDKKPREIFYPENPPVTVRKITIAGTCMNRPDWYYALDEMKFTHVYSNKACGMDWKKLNEMGIKVIMTVTGEDVMQWAEFVEGNMGKEVCGGYWHDGLGHEPDITGPNLQLRKDFYNLVRSIDKDAYNHPVMEMMNSTGKWDFTNPDGSNVYPGWEDAFSDDTHDLLLADIYPDNTNKEDMIRGMEQAWNKFIKIYPRKHQLIIQMIANGNNYWPGYAWTQYNFWKEKMASPEFQNPYGGPIGACWYKQELWMKSEEMQNEIARIHEEVLRK